jgi:glucans biosynthesis protein
MECPLSPFLAAKRTFSIPQHCRHCFPTTVKGSARCRMHGGKGSGAPEVNRNAWKHGAKSASTLETQALIRALARALDGDTFNDEWA